MAARFKELDHLTAANSELREALRDCHDLLEGTASYLRLGRTMIRRAKANPRS